MPSAKSEKIPGPLDRRLLIERDLPVEKCIGLAEAYLAEGRASEAVVFLKKADARDRLAALADDAASKGDAFLFREATQALGEEPSSDRWQALLDAAEASGKQRYAETARRWANRGDT
jgi:hypothetical protein